MCRSAPRGRNEWLKDIESVYPSEEVPLWVLSNYFYREMTPILRWFLLPFLILFGVSVVVFAGRALERTGLLRTTVFGRRFRTRWGLIGGLLDLVFWVNGVVIAFIIVLAIPAHFLSRDIRAALARYGVDVSEKLKEEKDRAYVEAAEEVFRNDPSVAIFAYGHTHDASLRKLGPRYVINTGTWLKRLGRTPSLFRLVPDVYVPSYRLNYFIVSSRGKDIVLGYFVIPKDTPADLSLLERLMILGRRVPGFEPIPAETVIAGGG